uniref:Uncharacterized protein n=1 Tax=Anguilla anguilla TaxID=7936 RepID=A0A0E9WJI9_ANGAN
MARSILPVKPKNFLDNEETGSIKTRADMSADVFQLHSLVLGLILWICIMQAVAKRGSASPSFSRLKS